MIMKMKNKLFAFIAVITLLGCTIPGMHMKVEGNLLSNGDERIYIKSINQEIKIQNIANYEPNILGDGTYRIGNGDQISITVWGLPEIFPISNINPDQNLRRVDSNGDLYFPYVGLVKASNKTQNELRNDMTTELSKYFTDPQLDLSIARFNSQKVFILGEVLRPQRVRISDIPLSLSEAIGAVNGLRTETSEGSEVYIIRQPNQIDDFPRIFVADLSSPAGFITAGNFFLEDNDIVYVNANGTTRWNRVISQFFPFSSFLTSVDRLVND